MTSLQVLVLVLGTTALAGAIARVGLLKASVGGWVATGLVALPFALVVAAPFAPPEEVPPAQPTAVPPAADEPARCRIVAIAGEPAGTRYVVRPAGCRPRARADETFTRGAGRIRSSTGRELRLVPGLVSGYIDRLTSAGDEASVDGWIGRVEPPRRAVDEFLVFVGDRFVAAMRPTVVRTDVAAKYGAPLRRSGFRFDLPLVDLRSGPLQGTAYLA